jgi:hypothetical protein
MTKRKFAFVALASATLLVMSGTASAVTCGPGTVAATYTVDGVSACAGPIAGNDQNNINLPADNPDMGFGHTDWQVIERDNADDLTQPWTSGLLRWRLDAGVQNAGDWQYTGNGGYSSLLLVVKAGNSWASFLVSGSINTWYDWSVVPKQGNGLSHMSLYGRLRRQDVPEPGTLALLGLGLVGLGAVHRKRP